MDEMIKKYSRFISEQSDSAPLTRLDTTRLNEALDTDEMLTEALNELGESEEVDEIAEALEILDLIEATSSALEKPLKSAHKGELGQAVKAAGGDRRSALLAKIRAKADTQREKAVSRGMQPGGKATQSGKEAEYWDKIGRRAANLQARHSGEGRVDSPSRQAGLRRSTNDAEGARGKAAGDTWQTSTGQHGGKNREGSIRYFTSADKAQEWARS